MNHYATYAHATSRLCNSAFGNIEDSARFKDRLQRLYNKIRKSRLTVYQKERLLLQLERTHLIAGNPAAGALLRARFSQGAAPAPQAAISKKSRKSELLAA